MFLLPPPASESVGSRWRRGRRGERGAPGSWKSCASRQTAEMKRRCLSTEDKKSPTAARGSDLCQCTDDLLQRPWKADARRPNLSSRRRRRRKEGFSFGSKLEPSWAVEQHASRPKEKKEQTSIIIIIRRIFVVLTRYKNVTRKVITAYVKKRSSNCPSLPPTKYEASQLLSQWSQ